MPRVKNLGIYTLTPVSHWLRTASRCINSLRHHPCHCTSSLPYIGTKRPSGKEMADAGRWKFVSEYLNDKAQRIKAGYQ